MNWLDWLIIVILGLSAFKGLYRGLLGSIASLLAVIAGLYVAYTYYQSLAEYLTANWAVGEKIRPFVNKLFEWWAPAPGNVPGLEGENLIHIGNLIEVQWQNAVDPLVTSLTELVLEAGCFIALLLFTIWVVNLVGFALTKAAQHSMLSIPNHLGGLLFGIVRGVVMVIIMLALLTPFQNFATSYHSIPGLPETLQRKDNAFSESILYPYFEPFLEVIEGKDFLDNILNV